MANKLKLVLRGMNPFRMKKKPSKSSEQSTGFTPPTNISEEPSFFETVSLEQWQATLDQFAEGEAHDLLQAWMDTIIRENGRANAAKMINDGADAGNLLTWETSYKRDTAIAYIGNMMDYLPDQGVMYKDQMLDRVDYMKQLGDALEQQEDWEQPD